MENKDQPANPATLHQVKGNDIETVTFPGLSKREFLAGQALQGLLSNRRNILADITPNTAKLYADKAVKLADYLLNELEK